MINVTETAAEKINELLNEENKVGAGLRVFVQGGGCSGFQYGLMIDEGEGDPAADKVFEVNGVRLYVDPISLRYLQGAEVDFVDNNNGGGFTMQNHNAKYTRRRHDQEPERQVPLRLRLFLPDLGRRSREPAPSASGACRPCSPPPSSSR